MYVNFTFADVAVLVVEVASVCVNFTFADVAVWVVVVASVCVCLYV